MDQRSGRLIRLRSRAALKTKLETIGLRGHASQFGEMGNKIKAGNKGWVEWLFENLKN